MSLKKRAAVESQRKAIRSGCKRKAGKYSYGDQATLLIVSGVSEALLNVTDFNPATVCLAELGK